MRRSSRGFFNKKGVSPLIATVLLISFAVALGSVVLNWGRNLDISTGDDLCANLEIEVIKTGGSELCYSGSGPEAFLEFAVRNSGSKTLEGLGVWAVGQKGTKLIDLDQVVILPEDSFTVGADLVPYSFDTYGPIKHVQLIPKSSTPEGLEICPTLAVKVTAITACG